MKDVLLDRAGIEVKAGDILEDPREDEDCAFKYCVASISQFDGSLEVRDGHGNLIGDFIENYFIIGPYWEHLDKIDDETLEINFNTTREEALMKMGVE